MVPGRYGRSQGQSASLPFGLRSIRSSGVLVVGLDPPRRLHPGMPAAVVDRNLRRRKARVGKRANGDAHGRVLVAFLGVEHGRSANRAEAEPESGALVAGADVLGCGAMDRVGAAKLASAANQLPSGADRRGNDRADFAWLAVNFDAQLAAGAGGGSGGPGCSLCVL